MKYAKVLIENFFQVDSLYSYIIPTSLIDVIEIGQKVKVEFGNSIRCAYVISFHKSSTDANKEILEIIDYDSVFNEESLFLIDYLYQHSLERYWNYFNLVCINLKKSKVEKIVRKIENVPELTTYFKKKDFFVLNSKNKELVALVKELEKANKVKVTSEIKIPKKKKADDCFLVDKTKLTPEFFGYLDVFDSINSIVVSKDDLLSFDIDEKDIEPLLECSALISKDEIKTDEIQYLKSDLMQLNTEQQDIFEKLNNKLDEYSENLLFGVTGSGKTEIYIHLINETIKKGKQVILLVPQISLLAQIASRVSQVFNGVSVISHKTKKKKKELELTKLELGISKILIGTRLSIFSYLPNLGLVIVDEESDSSYFQNFEPKYDCIKVAIEKAKHYNCPILYGSATPRIPTYYRAISGLIGFYELKNKALTSDITELEIIDLKGVKTKESTPISEQLFNEMELTLENNNQVLVLVNRKGYSKTLKCNNCGTVIKCPNCDIPLTYYKTKNIFKCHYCDYTTPYEEKCRKCKKGSLVPLSYGIEKIEEVLVKLFPSRVVRRVDANLTNNYEVSRDILQEFANHKIDILIGTQLISKGFDFNNVGLAVVPSVDNILEVPSFSSTEEAYSLLYQLMGRVGRYFKGKIVVQTYFPDHFVLNSLDKDYNYFYNQAIEIREKAKLDPFYNNYQVVCISLGFYDAYKVAFSIAKGINRIHPSYIVLGPSNALIPKINNLNRVCLTVKFSLTDIFSTDRLRKYIETIDTKGVRVELYSNIEDFK